MSCDFKGAERNIDRGPNQKYCTEKLVVECFLIMLLLIKIHLIYFFYWQLSISRYLEYLHLKVLSNVKIDSLDTFANFTVHLLFSQISDA